MGQPDGTRWLSETERPPVLAKLPLVVRACVCVAVLVRNGPGGIHTLECICDGACVHLFGLHLPAAKLIIIYHVIILYGH